MKPRYANARRLTEYLLGIEALRLVVIHGVHDRGSENTKSILLALDNAIIAATPEGVLSERSKIWRRVVKVVTDVMIKPFQEQEEKVAKYGLAVYYLLRNLIDQGRFGVEEGSEVEDAMEAILGGLSEYTTKEHEKLDKSAFKAGRRMLERLQKEGYYTDATWVLTFEHVE